MVTVRQLIRQLVDLPLDASVFIVGPDDTRDYDVEFILEEDGTVRVW